MVGLGASTSPGVGELRILSPGGGQPAAISALSSKILFLSHQGLATLRVSVPRFSCKAPAIYLQWVPLARILIRWKGS